MKCFIIFYSDSYRYDSVYVLADSLDEASEIAQGLSRVHAITILGIFEQSLYRKLHPHE